MRRLRLAFWRRPERWQPVDWDIRITVPEGTLVDADTEHLWYSWKFGQRSNDGYLDLLAGYRGGIHVWVKPRGWTEPDRTEALDGTGALPQSMRGALPYGMRRQR